MLIYITVPLVGCINPLVGCINPPDRCINPLNVIASLFFWISIVHLPRMA